MAEKSGARKTLVTGGAGFLGSHVCDRLISEGDHVVCFDNLQTGRLANIVQLVGQPRFTFVEGDVRKALPEGDFDEIWNLACPASPPQYQNDPIGTMMTCVVGTHAVLERAQACGARVLQASTSEIYGDPETHPQSEDYKGCVNPIGPRACYDEGKRAAETLCFDYRRLHRLDVRVARIFNTYGPRMDIADGRVVSNFIARARAGVPLELYGGGAQTRSFCYCDDLIDGLFALMRFEDSIGPVNLGFPEEFTVRELADVVIEMTGSASRITDAPMPIDDPRRRCPDITTARTLLGWTPSVPLREGLRRTIASFAAASAA